MVLPTHTPPLRCVNCELDIVGRAEFYAGLPFCCGGCLVGGPCTCSYDLFEEIRAIVEAGHVSEPVLSGKSRG